MDTLSRSQLGAYLGRNQGPEFFYGTTFLPLGALVVPQHLNLNRPLAELTLEVAFRVDISVAPYTNAAAESPQSIVNRIIVNGVYKGTQLTPINLSGASCFAMARIFNFVGNSVYIGTTRQPEPSSPFAQQVATLGAVGTYDVKLYLRIPVYPAIGKGTRAQTITPFLWQQADWGDSLQITLQFGDKTSLGTPGGTTVVAFSAFGSAAGNPSINIYTNYQILGQLRAGFRTAAVIRSEQTTQGLITANGSNVFLNQLQKQKTTRIVTKTGTLYTTSTAGLQVYQSLSDLLINATQITVDNRPIRNNMNDIVNKESLMQLNQTIIPQGYNLFDFLDGQNPRAAFRADLDTVVGRGANFGIFTNVISGAANQAATFIQEQIVADVDDPNWLGTR